MKRRLMTIAGLAALLALGAGLGHLFLMRFRVGDVYPPYSSLRTDPLGTRALHDSFAALPGLAVERNFQPLERGRFDTNTVLLFLGDTVSFSPNADILPVSTVGWMNRFVRSGGRMVIMLQPRDRLWTWQEDEDATNGLARKPGDRASTNATDRVAATNRSTRVRSVLLPEETDRLNPVALTNWLDAAFALQPVSGMATARVTRAGSAVGLPERLSVHTALCFTNAGPAWRVLYARDGRPVIMERTVGRGTFVISTLSYAVSNEALRDEREPGLLLWLLGGRTRVVFDETHHGLQEAAGMMTLVRRYGLTAALLNLMVLAGLFVWRNNAPLVPSTDGAPTEGPEVATGKDSATGLGNLLRRNIGRNDLVGECVAVWKRTEESGARLPATVIKRMEAMVEAERLLPDGQRSPARLYNAISEMVRREGREAGGKGKG
jgi:hypothetical protein